LLSDVRGAAFAVVAPEADEPGSTLEAIEDGSSRELEEIQDVLERAFEFVEHPLACLGRLFSVDAAVAREADAEEELVAVVATGETTTFLARCFGAVVPRACVPEVLACLSDGLLLLRGRTERCAL
jgi:hypothetical protein